jgi:hypothetical protein
MKEKITFFMIKIIISYLLALVVREYLKYKKEYKY